MGEMKSGHAFRLPFGLTLVAVLLTAACGSSSKPSAASSALQSYLPKHVGLEVTSVPPSTRTTIGQRQAEEIALRGSSKRPGTTAALWRVTDPMMYIPEHGIHRLLVNKQVAWIVLVPGATYSSAPDSAVPASKPYKPVKLTLAVVVNAETGNEVERFALPSRWN